MGLVADGIASNDEATAKKSAADVQNPAECDQIAPPLSATEK